MAKGKNFGPDKRKKEDSQPAPGFLSQSSSRSSESEKFRFRAYFIACAIICGAVLICYTNTLWYGVTLNDNITFAQLNLDEPSQFFSKLWAQALLQPLTQPWLRASFALDLINYGSTFAWYHLVNVFLHASCCVALFTLILRLSWRMRNFRSITVDPFVIALMSSLLYACHPLAVQPATYITSRYTALACANVLISLNCFLVGYFGQSNTARWWGYGLALAFGLMAVNANEVGLSLPPLMLALMILTRKGSISVWNLAVDRAYVFGALLILLCLPFTYFAGFAPGYAADFYALPLLSKAAYTATQFKALFTYYARCFVVPIGVSLDPPYTLANGWTDPLALCGAALVALFTVAIVKAKKYPIIVFGFILVLAGFIPHACIVQQESVADPVFYVSLGGACAVAGSILAELLTGTRRQTALKFAPIIVALAILTLLRNLEWRNENSLFAATLRTNPKSAVTLAWSALYQMAKKDYKDALKLADDALATDDKMAMAYLVKGGALERMGKFAEAREPLEKAEALSVAQKLPIQSSVELSLAECYVRLGQPGYDSQVAKLLYGVLAHEPKNGRVAYVMGLQAYQKGQYGQAHEFLKQAANGGAADGLPILAECALRLGQLDEAAYIAKTAVQVNDGAEARLSMAIVQIAQKQFEPAKTELAAILKENPSNALAMAYLSLTYRKLGNKALADSYDADARKLDAGIWSQVIQVSDGPAGR